MCMCMCICICKGMCMCMRMRMCMCMLGKVFSPARGHLSQPTTFWLFLNKTIMKKSVAPYTFLVTQNFG